jgi:tetratricopeptide (TPR) repeat protein
MKVTASILVIIALQLTLSPQSVGQIWTLKLPKLDYRSRQTFLSSYHGARIAQAQTALELTENIVGPDSLDVAPILDALAADHTELGDHLLAKPLHERALRIREKALGPDHLDVATNLRALAMCHSALNDDVSALPLFQRALGIREATLGPDHMDVATSLCDLASCYRYFEPYLGSPFGYHAWIEGLYLRALEILEKQLGPESLSVAECLCAIASLNNTRPFGHQDPAFIYRRALAIREKVLGPNHPDVATTLCNLATTFRDDLFPLVLYPGSTFHDGWSYVDIQGHYPWALRLYTRALKIREATFGSDHPLVAMTLRSLAEIHWRSHDIAKAEALLMRSLKICETVLGKEHQDVAKTLYDLASVYYSQRDYAKAEPLLEQSIKIREKALGPNHFDVGSSMSLLSSLYEHTERKEERSFLKKRVSEITYRGTPIKPPPAGTEDY